MTKKEVVTELRKKFNSWVAELPDIEYKSFGDNSEIHEPCDCTDTLHILELGAEEEGGAE